MGIWRRTFINRKTWGFEQHGVRFNIFPSLFHPGRFSQIPHENRLCPFCMLEPDTLEHILTRCPMHATLRNSFLGSFLWYPPGPFIYPIFALLSDNSADITIAVAGFHNQIIKLSPLF